MGNETDEKTNDTGTPAATHPALIGDAEVQAFNDHVAALATEDQTDVSEKVLRAVLAATSAEDILRAGEAMPATELLNIPIRVLGIRASESGFVEGADYYLHVDAQIIANGDSVTFSCGASDVAMKLIRMDQLGLFPVACRIERATKATKAGFFPLFLRALDANGEPF